MKHYHLHPSPQHLHPQSPYPNLYLPSQSQQP